MDENQSIMSDYKLQYCKSMPQYFYKEQYIMLYIWRWWHYPGDLQLESSKTKTNRIGDTIYNLAYIVLQYSDRKCYERTSKIHLYPILQIDAYLVLDQFRETILIPINDEPRHFTKLIVAMDLLYSCLVWSRFSIGLYDFLQPREGWSFFKLHEGWIMGNPCKECKTLIFWYKDPLCSFVQKPSSNLWEP